MATFRPDERRSVRRGSALLRKWRFAIKRPGEKCLTPVERFRKTGHETGNSPNPALYMRWFSANCLRRTRREGNETGRSSAT